MNMQYVSVETSRLDLMLQKHSCMYWDVSVERKTNLKQPFMSNSASTSFCTATVKHPDEVISKKKHIFFRGQKTLKIA